MKYPSWIPVSGRSLLMACACLTPVAYADSYATAVAADSPLAYFPLGIPAPPDDAINSGSAGAALNGSHINVQHQVPGALVADSNPSNAYNGSSRTLIPYSADLNPPASGDFTVEAWLRPDIEGLGNAQAPLFNRQSPPGGPRHGWAVFQRASGAVSEPSNGYGWNLRMYNGIDESTSVDITGGNYAVGGWSHLAIVWDGNTGPGTGTVTFYVDGLMVGTPQSGVVYSPNMLAPFGIGAYSATAEGDNPFTGAVDEVAFYPHALTENQISEHVQNAYDSAPLQSYAELVEADGAILHLRMDEIEPWRVPAVNEGSLGSAGNGVHFPGVTHEVPGALAAGGDTAIRYDRIDKESTDGNYATLLPSIAELNTESFSWETWIRPTAEGAGNAQCPVKNHDPGSTRTGWVIWQRASNAGSGSAFGWNLRLYNGIGNNAIINLNSGSGAGGYTIGQWQHLAVTFDHTTQTAVMYVNGAQVATQTASAGNTYVPNFPGTIIPSLGGFPNGTENPFEGDMDEVAFYDKVLTPAQVAAHYANGSNASPGMPYEELIDSHGPVAYYRMNEAEKTTVANAGTLADAADAVLVNATQPVPGPRPPAYGGFDANTDASQFDGTNTYLEVRNPAGLNFTGPLTLEAWIQPAATQPNADAYIISHGANHDFSKEVFLRIENGSYEVGTHENGVSRKASFPMPVEDTSGSAWVHLAGTWSDGQWTLYRNGSEVANASDATGPVLVNNANWAVGARGRWKYGAGFPSNQNPGEARVFSGAITDAAIYNTGLTAEKVRAHFFAGVGDSPLAISRPDGVITLDWAGGILQESDDLIQWNDVPAAVAPYAPADGERHFYRLRY